MNAAQLKELIESMTKLFEDAAKDIFKANRSGSKETNHVKVRSFSGNDDDDPIEWFDDFEWAAEANNWSDERKLKIASGYLKGMAAEWYKDNKANIDGWKDEDDQDHSFYHLLVTYFATPEKQHKWQIQLNNLAQLENEKVDAYAIKFKKLLSQVDPEDSLPAQYIIRMFLSGLKGKTATFVAVTSPGNLNEAIVAARKVEAGEYYGTHTHEASMTPDKKDEIIEALVKQVQQLSVNYVTANNQQEKDTRERERYRENPKLRKEIICYRCGEKGHIARNCMSEKKHKGSTETDKAPTESVSRINYCENELYAVDKRKQQIQLDTPEKNPKLQPELKWDNKLRPWAENKLLLVDVGDQLKPVKATVGQMLQYPNQRRNLAQILRRPLAAQEPQETQMTQGAQETHVVNFSDNPRTTAAHCYIRIKGNPIRAVLDSGAAVSIITKKLMDKLKLKIDKPSSTVVITATGTRTRALGQIEDVKIAIQDILLPSTFQVIESADETLLLGNDWFHRAQARIHFDEQRLLLKHEDRRIEVPISNSGEKKIGSARRERPA